MKKPPPPLFVSASYAEDLTLRFNRRFYAVGRRKFDLIMRGHEATPTIGHVGHAMVERRTGRVFRFAPGGTPAQTAYRFSSVLDALSADVDVEGKYLERLTGLAPNGCEISVPHTPPLHIDWYCRHHEVELKLDPALPVETCPTRKTMRCPVAARLA